MVLLLVRLVSWITKYQRKNATQISELLNFFLSLRLIESSNVYLF